jgi:hypothetical protein
VQHSRHAGGAAEPAGDDRIVQRPIRGPAGSSK